MATKDRKEYDNGGSAPAGSTENEGTPSTKDIQGTETEGTEGQQGFPFEKPLNMIKREFAYGNVPQGDNSPSGLTQPQTSEGTQTDGEAQTSGKTKTEGAVKAEPDWDAIEAEERQMLIDANAKQVKGIQDLLDRMNAPEDAETRRRRERRERSNRIIGAIGDGLRSLGNLVYTTKYAPDMYKGSTRQLESTDRWIEKMKAARDSEEAAYNSLSERLRNKEGELPKALLELKARQEERKRKEAEAKRKAEAHAAEMERAPFKKREAKAKAGTAENKEAISALDLKNKPTEIALNNDILQGKIEVLKSKKDKNIAQAAKAWSEGKKPFHFDGKPYWKDNEHDYVKAISDGADEVNAYFAERNADGTLKKDDKGNVVYRKGYDPIYVSYENRNGEEKYYEWAETGAKVERYLKKMREEQGKGGKKNPNPMSSGGKQPNPMH